MNKDNRKCQCKKILGRDKIYLHLSGCPEDYWTKEYNEMPWYKKLCYRSPRKIYNYHLKL